MLLGTHFSFLLCCAQVCGAFDRPFLLKVIINDLASSSELRKRCALLVQMLAARQLLVR